LELSATRKLKRIRLPELYWESRLSIIPDSPHKEVVEQWDHDNVRDRISEGKGLYIYGKWGTGKSAIAAIILKAAAANGIFGLWVNFKDLPSVHVDDDTFDDFETFPERLRAVDLLVIDEFEATKKKWFAIELMEDIVRTRHQNKKVTLITSNQSPVDLTFPGAKPTINDKELRHLTEGFLGVYPEAFHDLEVIGKNFRSGK
jgi:DNA replication protein DnaC